MSDDGWNELRLLITVIDSHRLVNDDPESRDEYLYEMVAEIRRRLG